MTTGEPCAGHTCDDCARCRRGICCRRDLPDYRLPTFGEWTGPIYGQFAQLANDGERAQCHICGEFYGRLCAHVLAKHELWADEYKILFGLRIGLGLVGPSTHAKLSANATRRAQDGEFGALMAGGGGIATLTPEQRAYLSRTRYRSPQEKQGRAAPPKAVLLERARVKDAARRGSEPIAAAPGTPEWTEEFGRRISAARGGHLGEFTCSICGATFTAERSARRRTGNAVCSNACLLEQRRRRQQAEPIARRPDVRAKVAAAARKRVITRGEHGRIRSWKHS